MNYNNLAQEAHENAVKHGFWEPKVSNEHCLMLVITEIAEMVEAHRVSRKANTAAYNDMPNKQIGFEKFIKNTMEDEMADIVIRLADLAGALGVNFDKMLPCRYYRAYSKFSFTENAFALSKGLCRDGIGIEKRIQFGLDFVTKWAQELNIELAFFVAQKMRYNVMRPYRNGKQY